MDSEFLAERVLWQLVAGAVGGATLALGLARDIVRWRRDRPLGLTLGSPRNCDVVTRQEIVSLFASLPPAARVEVLAALEDVA
jgi:hypothetical protein